MTAFSTIDGNLFLMGLYREHSNMKCASFPHALCYFRRGWVAMSVLVI